MTSLCLEISYYHVLSEVNRLKVLQEDITTPNNVYNESEWCLFVRVESELRAMRAQLMILRDQMLDSDIYFEPEFYD